MYLVENKGLMKTSLAGKQFIKNNEGLRLKAYLCSAGVPTIGWGHTGRLTPPLVKPTDIITLHQAEEYFENDIAATEADLARLTSAKLTQNQYDALIDFVFNLGFTQVRNATLFKRLNRGDYEGVPGELLKWKHEMTPKGSVIINPGLLKRRQKEVDVWRAG